VLDGVRGAVGCGGPSNLISLPGPNDEVRLAAGVMLECLKNNCSKEQMAQKIAAVLAEKLMQKGFHHEHHDHHNGHHDHHGHHKEKH